MHPKIARTMTLNDTTDFFTQVVLYTDIDGRARFAERQIPLTEGKPAARLSVCMPSGGLQLRRSPVGLM